MISKIINVCYGTRWKETNLPGYGKKTYLGKITIKMKQELVTKNE